MSDRRTVKRFNAAVRREGLCVFCTCRVVTNGGAHCRGNEQRAYGACKIDGKLPQFRLDDETLGALRDAT